MKKIVFLLLLLWLTGQKSWAQSKTGVDFEKIYAAIADKTSKFYYPTLLARYMAHDDSLTPEDMHYLYYGFTAQPTYNPLNPTTLQRHENQQKRYIRLLQEWKLDEARNLLMAEFRRNPFDLDLLSKMITLAKGMQQPSAVQVWTDKYNTVVKTIQNSGDGLTEQTAWVLIDDTFETRFLKNMGLEPSDPKFIKDKYHLWTVKTPNPLNTGGVYTDIEKPFKFKMKAIYKTFGVMVEE